MGKWVHTSASSSSVASSTDVGHQHLVGRSREHEGPVSPTAVRRVRGLKQLGV